MVSGLRSGVSSRGRIVVVVALLAGVLGVVAPAGAQEAPPGCTITGTEGPDVLAGTSGDDVICGLGGDDVIDAGDGDDVVYAGDGDDYVEGGFGQDTLFGGLGDDELRGNEDPDVIYGEDGNDVLGGGKGPDVIYGGAGADYVEGKTGADTIYGGLGDDELRGNEDPDVIYGEDGDDSLFGGKQDDELYGGPGFDTADGKKHTDLCEAEVTVNCEAVPLTIIDPADGDIVFDVETVTVAVDPITPATSVDLLVGGLVVGTAPVTAGTALFMWDTTIVTDGEVTLVAVGRDVGGIEVSSGAISVVVADDSASSIDRVVYDYAQGLIAADEYVQRAFAAVMNSGVDDRYESSSGSLFGEPYDPDNPPDGTQLGLSLLSVWDELSPEVQDVLASMGDVTGPITGVFIPSDSPNQQQYESARTAVTQAAAVSDCLPVGQVWESLAGAYSLTSATSKGFGCRTVFGHSTVYWNMVDGTHETPLGRLIPMDGLVNPADSDGNGTPDYIDVIGEQLDNAWVVYTSMGYEQPQMVNVYVHDMGWAGASVGAMVLPTFIQFENNLDHDGSGLPSQSLPRHEQFHVAQLDTMNTTFAGAGRLEGSVRWWMEATANWAAHQTIEVIPLTDGSQGRYHGRLGLLLSEPEQSLVEEPGSFFGVQVLPLPPTRRAYGTFILAEWLDENLTFNNGATDGRDAVRRTFIAARASGTTAQEAIQTVIEVEADNNPTLSSVLTGFAVDNYLMAEPTAAGYEDADALHADPDEVDWLDRLDGTEQRPSQTPVPLTPDDQHIGLFSGLGRGGAHYVEFTAVLAAGPGTVTITTDPVPDVQYRALRITEGGDGPELCGGAADIIMLEPGISTEIDIDAPCTTVTLVAVYADLDNSSRDVSWEAIYESKDGVLINPGFETGDLTGWTPFGVPASDVSVDTINTRSGSFSATVGLDTGTSGGIEQVVPVTQNADYRAAVWISSNVVVPDIGLRILEPDGTVIAEHLRGIGPSNWARLTVPFTAPGAEVRFQLWGVNLSGDRVEIDWDDATLFEANAVAWVNSDFDDSETELLGWSVVGDQYGTVEPVVEDATTGDIVASVAVDNVGGVVGFEQLVDVGGAANGADIKAQVVGGAGGNVRLEAIRLDGTVVAVTDVVLLAGDGEVVVGMGLWSLFGEGILTIRATVNATPGTVLWFDDARLTISI